MGLFWETNDDLQARKRKAAPSEAEPFETGWWRRGGSLPVRCVNALIRVGGGIPRADHGRVEKEIGKCRNQKSVPSQQRRVRSPPLRSRSTVRLKASGRRLAVVIATNGITGFRTSS